MRRREFLVTAGTIVPALAGCLAKADGLPQSHAAAATFEVVKTEDEWRRLLSPAAFSVLRKHDTERPGSSPLNGEHRAGVYRCAGCDLPLYESRAKFESGTGWPSFTSAIDGAIGTSIDRSLLESRIEVHCRRCGGHLGHVFDDGPPPTGKRYCMNGAALTFSPATQGA